MSKIYYITYDDININCDAHGIFTFDTDKIYKNIAKRYYTMPSWIKPLVDKVFDNKILIGADSRDDIRAIINQKLVEINNLVVPIARLNKLNNSGIPDWMQIPKYLDKNDITIDVLPVYTKGENSGFQLSVDFTSLVDRIYKEHEAVDEVVRGELVHAITEYIKGDKSIQSVIPMDFRSAINHVDKYKDNILAIANDFITSYAESALLSDMKDTVGLNPYFSYDLSQLKVTYTEDRVLHLLDAMDYAAVDNPEDMIDYINNHCKEIEEEMIQVLDNMSYDKEDEYLAENLAMSVNISILNRVLFVRNNSIRPDEAVGLIYPKPAASQLDVELFYMDACTEMMTYDIVLDDLADDLDTPKHTLHEDVEWMIREVRNTYDLLTKQGSTLDIIYKGVRHTYFDVYGKLYDKYTVKEQHTHMNSPIKYSMSNFFAQN